MSRRLVALGLAVVLVASALVWWTGRSGTRQVSAVLPSAVSLFPGSDVRIMGVRVGKVTAVTPRPDSVLVEMEYDDDYSLPADAQAIVISPSVIGDRYVQLTPAYDGGPRLAAGATIPRSRTAVPVELDDMVASTTRLADALGPRGANREGAVTRLLDVAAESLTGLGDELNASLRDVSAASDTFAESAPGLRRTVRSGAGLTGELARYDDAVRTLDTRLSRVARSLAADRGDLSKLLESLARSLGEVAVFVRDNRAALRSNVDGLRSVTRALRAERKSLVQVTDLVPLGFTNLIETYDARTESVRTRANFTEVLQAVDKAVCAELQKQLGDAVKDSCQVLGALLAGLPLPGTGEGTPGAPGLPGLTGSPSSGGPLGDLLGLPRLRELEGSG
jgi:virulence factor Mce-like protein